MTLGVDLRCLPADGSPGSGIAHATRELWTAFSVARHNTILGFAETGARIDAAKDRIVWLRNKSSSLFRKTIREWKLDWLFVPSGAVPFGISIPVYPWVHDVAIFDHPEWFSESWVRRQITTRLFLRGLKQAEHIFCVSEDTKWQLLRKWNIDPARMTVTYQGVSISHKRNEDQSKPYALILGSVEPRKNIPFIVSLWPEVCKRLRKDANLIIAGNEEWGDVRWRLHPSVLRKKNISDEDASGLIKCASIVLLPSLHEGFGRVAVEAMAYGTPLVASERGALPEVIGDGGWIIPLEEHGTWINAIVELFEDEDVRSFLSTKGLERAKFFDWDKTAQSILAVLEKK